MSGGDNHPAVGEPQRRDDLSQLLGGIGGVSADVEHGHAVHRPDGPGAAGFWTILTPALSRVLKLTA